MKKVEVVSVQKSEFFQDPKDKLSLDGKVFDDFTKADTYCIRKNSGEVR